MIFNSHDDIGSVELADFIPIIDFGSVTITTRGPVLEDLGIGFEVEEIGETAGVPILLSSTDKDTHARDGMSERQPGTKNMR